MKFNTKLFWETQLTSAYDLQGVGYTSLGAAYNQWMYKVRKYVIGKHLRKLPIQWQNSCVLDVGFGTGFYIKMYDDLKVKEITGFDITEIAVSEQAKKYSQYRFHTIDISNENLDQLYPKAQFNMVSSFDVLFHIVDDKLYQNAIRNCSYLTQDGGYFVFSDNFPSQQSSVTHQSHRTYDQITSTLKEYNFEIVEIAPIFHFMNGPVGSDNPLIKFTWKLLRFTLKYFPLLGHIIGPLQYPIDCFLSHRNKIGPSTNLIICKKNLN